MRRSFAITADTFAASRFLQTRTSFDPIAVEEDDKRLFEPHGVFAAGFRDHCVPGTLFFSELSGGSRSRVSRLSPGEAMARLIRMSPWSCYDRTTAAGHLAVLSALARQARAYSLLAGTDLLDPETYGEPDRGLHGRGVDMTAAPAEPGRRRTTACAASRSS